MKKTWHENLRELLMRAVPRSPGLILDSRSPVAEGHGAFNGQQGRQPWEELLAETINGQYKAELIHRRAHWKTGESMWLVPRNGCHDSTTIGCSNSSATSHRPSLRQTTTGQSLVRTPELSELDPPVSTKSGMVHHENNRSKSTK